MQTVVIEGNGMLKTFVYIVSGLILTVTLILAGLTAYNLLNPADLGESDKTANINVMLTRISGWKDIVDEPPVEQSVMSQIDGSTATVPITAEIFRQFYNVEDSMLSVDHSMTHSSYINLIQKQTVERGFDIGNGWTPYNNTISLIFVTAPSDEEQQMAKDNGVELDVRPIAMDGFVFITHKDNPIDSLTVQQIQDIYTGTITNWKQLGGPDLKIRAYQREKNSGSQTAMEQLVMNNKTMIKPIETSIYMGMGGLVDAVAEYDNGPASIGYTYYYYINNLYKNDNIKVLKVDGVSPDNDNLLSGRYAFTTSYYSVMRGDEPMDSPCRKLRDFLLGKKGQELIAMAGYCPAVQ